MKYYIKTQKIALSLFILLILSFSSEAQWNIPDEAKNTQLPTDPTYKLINIGKDIFTENCMSCHGMPGEGKNIAAINATDLGTFDYQSTHNAGQMYFQFNEGMGAMPSFKDKFNEDDKWCLTFYVKSFDKEFKISGEQVKVFNGMIDLKKDESAKKVFANITVTDDKGNTISNEGIGIVFYVKRYFGNLPIGDAVQTNQVGTAAIELPENIPGDEEGKIEVIAGFKDQNVYGSVIKSMELNWGTHLHFENYVLDRTMWGPNDRVPLWLLLTYLFITGGVWLTIIYVVFQITRIKKAGR